MVDLVGLFHSPTPSQAPLPSPEEVDSLFEGSNWEQDLVKHSSADFLSSSGQSEVPAKNTYSTALHALSFAGTDPRILSNSGV